MQVHVIVKFLVALLTINILAVWLAARTVGRGRFLLWGVQGALGLLWLTMAAIVLLSLRHYGIASLAVLVVPLLVALHYFRQALPPGA